MTTTGNDIPPEREWVLTRAPVMVDWIRAMRTIRSQLEAILEEAEDNLSGRRREDVEGRMLDLHRSAEDMAKSLVDLLDAMTIQQSETEAENIPR